MNKTIRLTLIMILAIISMASAVSVETVSAQDSDSKLNIVATTTQVADLTRIIGGDRVDVIGLMGGGVDPHLYKFTEADIEAMTNADLVLYNGLHLEGNIGEVIEAIGSRTRVYAVGDTIEDLGYTLPVAGEPDVIDPHMWFDPRNWRDLLDDYVEVLSDADPDNADFFAANAEAYKEELTLVYDWGVEAMSLIPEEQRVLVTSHDAFQYFGDAFGWEVRGLQGISTESEAGVGDIQELVDFVIEREIPALFVESSVPPATIEAVRNAALDRDWDVDIGGELYSDAMGEVGTYEGTYVGMLVTNIEIVVSAFGYGDELPELPEGVTTRDSFEDDDEEDENDDNEEASE